MPLSQLASNNGDCVSEYWETNLDLGAWSWKTMSNFLNGYGELSLGFILGFRIGFSAGELVDFLVGFAGFDPMDDDTSYTEPTYIDLPQPLTEKDWESKLDALDEKMDKRLTK